MLSCYQINVQTEVTSYLGIDLVKVYVARPHRVHEMWMIVISDNWRSTVLDKVYIPHGKESKFHVAFVKLLSWVVKQLYTCT